jgi:hypothetical protein
MPRSGGVTVHDGQLDIHQNKIRALFCDCREGLLSVFDFDDLILSWNWQAARVLPEASVNVPTRNAEAATTAVWEVDSRIHKAAPASGTIWKLS